MLRSRVGVMAGAVVALSAGSDGGGAQAMKVSPQPGVLGFPDALARSDHHDL